MLFRASDADRERVVAMLGEALADGRLSEDEYGEGMSVALTDHLIGSGTGRNTLFAGNTVGAVATVLGGLMAAFLGVNAEGKPLEDVTTPLSVVGNPPETAFRAGLQ